MITKRNTIEQEAAFGDDTKNTCRKTEDSLVPSRPRRFRTWRHLSSLLGKCHSVGTNWPADEAGRKTNKFQAFRPSQPRLFLLGKNDRQMEKINENYRTTFPKIFGTWLESNFVFTFMFIDS